MLLETMPVPMKYLYMGTSIQSSNFALPTSRLILFWKLRSYREHINRSGRPEPEAISAHDLEYRDVKRGQLGAMARTLNRVAEEWYRQLISWSYQLRGYTVLYDRHFKFEYNPDSNAVQSKSYRLSDRLHLWLLRHLYPRPHLTICLDAPPEVLLSRKRERTLDYLQKRRMAVLEQGQKTANFVLVDASQPLDKVCAEVTSHVMKYL